MNFTDNKIKEEFKKSFISKNGKMFFEINSGTIEMNNNTIIILSD